MTFQHNEAPFQAVMSPQFYVALTLHPEVRAGVGAGPIDPATVARIKSLNESSDPRQRKRAFRLAQKIRRLTNVAQ